MIQSEVNENSGEKHREVKALSITGSLRSFHEVKMAEQSLY